MPFLPSEAINGSGAMFTVVEGAKGFVNRLKTSRRVRNGKQRVAFLGKAINSIAFHISASPAQKGLPWLIPRVQTMELTVEKFEEPMFNAES